MRPKWSSNSGFTLIELVITVAVAAILLAAATPSFLDFIDKARLKGAAQDLVSFMVDARAESVKRNRNVNIAFGGTTTAWCVGAVAAAEPATTGDAISTAVTPCDCTSATSCTIAGVAKTISSSGYNGVGVAGSLPASSFTFDSRLGSVDPLGSTTVTLASPRAKYNLRVVISPLGQANLCVPTGKPVVTGFASC